MSEYYASMTNDEPLLSDPEARELPDGTPVLVRHGSWWKKATVRVFDGNSLYEENRTYALVQFEDPDLGWERTGLPPGRYWWVDSGITLDPDGVKPQESEEAVIQFPTKPYTTKAYWESVSNSPRVERRWFRLVLNGHVHDIFFMGNCLNPECNRSLWATESGVLLAEMEYQSLTILTGPDGRKYRACWPCASRTARVERIFEAAKDEKDPGPLVWPSREELEAQQKAKAAKAAAEVPLAV